MSTAKRVCTKSLHTAGFTLIELMLVLAVIGIIALYGVPKYQGVKEHYRLEGSTQAVVAQLKYAKQLAMDQRRISYVVVDSEGVSVVQLVSGNTKVIDHKTFDTGVSFQYNPVRDSWMTAVSDSSTGALLGHGVSFDLRGFVSENGTIWLESRGIQSVGVQIEEKTGSFSITWEENE